MFSIDQVKAGIVYVCSYRDDFDAKVKKIQVWKFELDFLKINQMDMELNIIRIRWRIIFIYFKQLNIKCWFRSSSQRIYLNVFYQLAALLTKAQTFYPRHLQRPLACNLENSIMNLSTCTVQPLKTGNLYTVRILLNRC